MTIRQIIKNFKSKSEINKEVVSYIIDRIDLDESINQIISTIENIRDNISGGSIGELIYYRDILAFCEKHSSEINKIISDYIQDYGNETFYKIFDVEDLLFLDTHNRNLASWIATETILSELVYEIEYHNQQVA